jgi:hypothetical protein
VLIQTEYPEHPLLRSLLTRATKVSRAPRSPSVPPRIGHRFAHVVALRASAGTLAPAIEFCARRGN